MYKISRVLKVVNDFWCPFQVSSISNSLKLEEMSAFIFLLEMWYKTAGYHRHILCPPIFGKKAFRKIKTFFFLEKTLFFHHSFKFFQRSKFLNFLQEKNDIIRSEDIFENRINWYAFTATLPRLAILNTIQKFFRETHLFFFQKKPEILNVLRTLPISVSEVWQSWQSWQS